MADTTTTNLSLTKPEVNVEDPVTDWGDKYNATLDTLDDKWTSVTPTAQVVGSGSAGSSTRVARADHVHPLSSATPSTQAMADAASAGVATTVARSDHKHAMPDGLLRAGGTMTGAIAMGSNKITGLAAGTTNGDALRYEQLVNLYLLLAGGTMSGNIAMGGNKVTGAGAASANGDLVRYEQMFGFRILQVQTGTTSTAATSTTTTYADTNLSVSITPASSSSKIIILVQQHVGSASSTDVGIQILRGASIIDGPFNAFWDSAALALINIPLFYVDSPATTSATTYKTQFARAAGGSTASVQNGGITTTTRSRMYLFELG